MQIRLCRAPAGSHQYKSGNKRWGDSRVTLAKSDRGWISGVAGEGIVTIGDPRLKAPTASVDHVEKVADLLATMTSRVRSMNGAGLAAPQIGASVKVVVI